MDLWCLALKVSDLNLCASGFESVRYGSLMIRFKSVSSGRNQKGQEVAGEKIQLSGPLLPPFITDWPGTLPKSHLQTHASRPETARPGARKKESVTTGTCGLNK